MAGPVTVRVAGLPAEMVREIGLRLADITISEFENSQQMGRAAAHGEARLVILSDSLPTDDAIYVARRARDASDEMRVAFLVSMQQAENALSALKDVPIDRFFLIPVATEEMLRELAKMARVELLPAEASHAEHIASAVFAAWDRTKPATFQKIDKLDDAAIALLENKLVDEEKSSAVREAAAIAEVATRFGFQKAIRVARDLAERFASNSLSAVDGLAVSEQLLALRQHLAGAPTPPAPSASDGARRPPAHTAAAFDEAHLEGKRILVVDDEPLVTRGLTSLLSRRGLVVTALNDPLKFG